MHIKKLPKFTFFLCTQRFFLIFCSRQHLTTSTYLVSKRKKVASPTHPNAGVILEWSLLVHIEMKHYNIFIHFLLFLVHRYLDNHVKGCGNSRKDEEMEQNQKHELIVGSPSNHASSNTGTVILISNEGQQAFMVANTNDSQTITLTQDV